ncbi:MAG: M23 family metallopeptidase [Patescibacteria group bacterium]
MSDVGYFLLFFRNYLWHKMTRFGGVFSSLKDFVVNILIFKRGKYSNSIINTSFIFLVLGIVVTAPTVAENNPFKDKDIYAQNIGLEQTQQLLSLEDGQISLDTYRSKVRDKVENYTTLEGDTVEGIAKKFNISEKSIEWANNLNSKKLQAGTVLKIPPVTGVIHSVQPGDNIYTLAKKYRVSAQNIVNFPFNDFRDSSFNLIAGSTLVIPEGVVVSEQNNSAPDTYNFAQVVAGVKGSSNFIWPTNGIITQYPTVYHMALDIANPSMPPVLASDAGTVIYSGCFSWGYGCHIIIDHGNGYKSLYGHLSQRLVEQGAVVIQGQQIGVMGSTGRSTGTHLHFEIRQGSVLLNPQSFLK